MLRLGRLTGLPVVHDGRTVGHVEQCVLTQDGKQLRGLTVRHGFGNAKWIPRSSIAVTGDVAVIVTHVPEKLPSGCDFALTTVFDTRGLPLGRITDVYVSRSALTVQALEVSLGPLETLRRGRYIVRSFSLAYAAEYPGAVLIPCGCSLERFSGNEVIQ